MKEASDAHNTMYIKFPTVTKLTYPFESPPEPQHLRTTSYRSNLNISSSIKLSLITKTQSFKIISLPEKNEIMNICTMTMRQKPQDEDSTEQQSARKKIFSVCKLNSLKLKGSYDPPSVKNPLHMNKKFSSLNKISIPVVSNIDFQQVYSQINQLIALSFGVVVSKEGYSRIRKGRVESGNNGLLVKQTIKKRLWWNIANEEAPLLESEGLNLIWTQHTLTNKQVAKLIQTNQQSISTQTRKYEQIKPVFNKNFEKTFNSLQKVKQLFFTQWEEQPLRIKDWLFKLSHDNQYTLSPQFMTLSNHLPNNWEITNKKLLYKNMVQYYRSINTDPHEHVPKTFHLTCFNWQQVIKEIRGETNKWILKPGEFTNRGKGITVFRSTKQALDYILLHPPKTEERTFLLQEYITPTLYQQRKFDIRCYILGVEIHNSLKFYWFEEGYIRTASQKFTLKKVSKSIHLTNDAIQKGMKNYGEHESANKLSYSQIDKYFLNNTTFNFTTQILPEMKRISRDICHAVGDSNLIGAGAGCSFEVFGLDFLVDQGGKPWLIEVNTNPCLDVGCTLLSRIIPQLLENTWRLVLDVFLAPRKVPDYAQHFLLSNKYSLIYSKKRQPPLE